MTLPIYDFKAINIKANDICCFVDSDKTRKVISIRFDNENGIDIKFEDNLSFYWGLYEKPSDNIILLRKI